jgi:hypothetical protein
LDPKLTLCERKKYQTMASILDAFLVSLEDLAFHEVLIEEVCDKTSISKMAFFRYLVPRKRFSTICYALVLSKEPRNQKIHCGLRVPNLQVGGHSAEDVLFVLTCGTVME